jgi:hypothetical protein
MALSVIVPRHYHQHLTTLSPSSPPETLRPETSANRAASSTPLLMESLPLLAAARLKAISTVR